ARRRALAPGPEGDPRPTRRTPRSAARVRPVFRLRLARHRPVQHSLDKRALENVFDRFWQAPSRTGGDTGMGLGLSIVKHIVNLHGGTVSARSEGLGMGSVFTIRLPLPVTTAGFGEPARRHPTVAPISDAARVLRLE